MDQRLLSPDSAPRGIVGANVHRRDSNDSITDEQKFETRVSRGDTQRGDRQNSDPFTETYSPFERSYDPPNFPHDADITMQNQDESRAENSPSETMKMGYSPADGSFNDDSDKRSLLSTAKKYDHRETRMFLLKTGSYRLCLTIIFCVLIAFALKCYEGFDKPRILGKTRVRWFNALMIGLSLALGLNLASSLKKYAVILRWSLLTRRYVSLEVFDLILGLETLTKVFKLMIISAPGIRKIKTLKKLPWFRDARDDGTRYTWIVCMLWLMVNVGAQVLVASLSLFWPVDPSDAAPLMKYGDVVVSDLKNWVIDPINPTYNATSMEEAWFAGNEAAVYPSYSANESMTDLSSLPGPPFYNISNSHFEYRFINRNPAHEFSQYLVTSRTVKAKATCTELKLWDNEVHQEGENNDGAYYVWGQVRSHLSYIYATTGSLKPASNVACIDHRGPPPPETNATHSQVVRSLLTDLQKPGDEDYGVHYLTEKTPGSIAWTGAVQEFCGPRCTNFTVYQFADNDRIKAAALFLCENTLGEVEGVDKSFSGLTDEDKKTLHGTDSFARIAAGAMSWTGFVENGWTDRQTRSYTRGSKWSPTWMVKKDEVEAILARFTIGAVAAFDDHGLRYTVKNQHNRPVQGQQLQVDWGWVFGLLGGIILIQSAALAALMIFANKSIIRDDSFFSMAMLLSPVVNRLGREGMNMTGDEIKGHPRLLWKRIRYDYREGENGEPNQVSIFFQGKDMFEPRRSWAGGNYI